MALMLLSAMMLCCMAPSRRWGEDDPKPSYQHRLCIQDYINQAKKDIAGIYENALKRNSQIGGMVHVRFLIGETGRVDSVQAPTSTLNDSLFQQSVLNAVRKWKFPVSPGFETTEIVLPFAFEGAQE
jgi:TonB family protein